MMTVNISLLFVLLLVLLGKYLPLVSLQTSDALLALVGVIATIPVVISAVSAAFRKRITVDLLASIALFVSMLKGEWVSVAFINLMITSARIFGEYTEGKARIAIRGLLKLRPEFVKVKMGKELMTKRLTEVRVGDVVIVESGERVPIDGIVIEGEGTIDQSSLTGESLPIEKHEKDMLLSSTLAISGSFLVRTERIGKDTTFEKIVALVEGAQMGKAGIQTIADSFASWYILITILGASAVYLFSGDTNLVLTVLLVTCADDIAVAVPLAFWAAIAYAAKRGVIIKGGNYLEGLTKVTTLLVDKTGTLTTGKITVHDVIAYGSHTKQTILKYAAFAGSISNHPISKAIVAYALLQKIHSETPEKFDEHPGKGIMTMMEGKHIAIGNRKLMEDEHIVISYEQLQEFNKLSYQGYTVIFVGYGGKCEGLIVLADAIRPGIRHVIQRLKQMGIREVIMLTGDNDAVANRVMTETGVTEYHANLLPEEKVAFVASHLGIHHKLAMVGDGVNDAAALARSDIGIAMGAIGSDAAIESADIALMHDDFGKLPEVVVIGRHTMDIVSQNFIIWGIVNCVGLLLAFTRTIGPAEAAAFNFITDFFPLANSMRLFRRQHFDRVIG